MTIIATAGGARLPRVLTWLAALAVGAVAAVAALGWATLATAAEPDPARQLREYRDAAMGRDGNVERGRAVFHDEQRAACARCHSIDGKSGKAGPDLMAVGDRFPRRELIRAVLEPSAAIAVGYGTTIVTTKDGGEVQGVVKQVTADALELMGGDGKAVRIATRDIAEQRGSVVSLMPEGLQAGLSRDEFVDLIGYLASLRQPESALASNRGMPPEIPELARPIAIRPFISEALRFPHNHVHKPGDVRSGLVWLGSLPGATNSFLVVHQTGKIWLLEKATTPGGEDRETVFGDLAKDVFNERGPNGLLGLAFHPRFAENGRYFLKHQVFEQNRIVTTVVERRAAPGGRTDSGQPSRRIWEVQSATQDHSGGCLGFGPDGFLYIAMGDTGPQQDPQGHGQDRMTHLGKILRIDVDHAEPGKPYAVPADNPFVGQAGARPEIWALGFREPWRFSFDRATGDLWVGDVGQDRVEEVSIVRRGENHGWNVYEGFEPFSNRYRREGETYVPPVFAYRRKFGNSITGGHVYRADPKSSFHGVYICGDYTSRRIFGIRQKDRRLDVVRQIGVLPQGIASFTEAADGRLFAVGYEGMIYELDFAGASFDEVAPAAGPSAKAPAAAEGRPAGATDGSVRWERRAVALPESIWSVEALDANGDGRRDLVAMGETRVFAALAPDWRVEELANTREPKMLYSVALDADGDGDLDLAVGRYRQPWLEYREAVAAGKAATEPKGPDFSIAWLENVGRVGAAWPLHVVDREFNGIHGLWVGDVNRDGVKDLLADSIMGPAFPRSLAWFAVGKSAAQQPWPRHLVTKGGADGRPHYLDFADLSGDGRGDLLVGDPGAGTFTWWEQPSREGAEWTRHLMAKEPGATNLRMADVNRDGVPDAVGSCGHGLGVFWFAGPDWRKTVIDGALRDAHALAVEDFDGDGDVDVATASFGAKLVRWYVNDGRGGFQARDIDTGNRQEAYDLKSTDLDGDGRVDLILAGRETRNAVWYRNLPAAASPR